ncbi:hypothetical protein Peur_014682 [Populus x canadensis]
MSSWVHLGACPFSTWVQHLFELMLSWVRPNHLILGRGLTLIFSARNELPSSSKGVDHKQGTTPRYSYSTANKNMAISSGENTLYGNLLNLKKFARPTQVWVQCLAKLEDEPPDPCMLGFIAWLGSDMVGLVVCHTHACLGSALS